jgi:hypothetical protein
VLSRQTGSGLEPRLSVILTAPGPPQSPHHLPPYVSVDAPVILTALVNENDTVALIDLP